MPRTLGTNGGGPHVAGKQQVEPGEPDKVARVDRRTPEKAAEADRALATGS